MTRDRHQPPHAPTADQLAAYFDGELTGTERAAVEAWLADQADAGRDTAFADADDDLVRACQATPPSEPALDAWDAVLGRIAAAVAPGGAPPRRRYIGTIVGAAAATAAALGLVFLGRALWPAPEAEPLGAVTKLFEDLDDAFVQGERERPDGRNRRLGPEIDEPEPFPVLAASEVRVICMDGDDVFVDIDGRMVKSLVVGEPPVPDDVLYPTSYDKTRLVSPIDPELRFEGWSVPMVVDPAVLAKGWQP
jgi:hypothetical protein